MSASAAVFVCYTVLVFLIALAAYSRTENHRDFLLANRQLSGPLAALSAGASDMSGWLLLGLPGLAYVAHREAFFIAAGLALGTYLNWRWIAAPLREKTVIHGESLTLPT
ncbi:MAG: sodium:proline symporter, partial [Pseudomonadota bacterium]